MEEARQLLLRLGGRKFGPADPAILERIASLHDLNQLEELAARLFDAISWKELLDSE